MSRNDLKHSLCSPMNHIRSQLTESSTELTDERRTFQEVIQFSSFTQKVCSFTTKLLADNTFILLSFDFSWVEPFTPPKT